MFTKSDKCDIIFLLYMTRGDCMIKKEMIAMLLAGGQGSRLGVLLHRKDVWRPIGLQRKILRVVCEKPIRERHNGRKSALLDAAFGSFGHFVVYNDSHDCLFV